MSDLYRLAEIERKIDEIHEMAVQLLLTVKGKHPFASSYTGRYEDDGSLTIAVKPAPPPAPDLYGSDKDYDDAPMERDSEGNEINYHDGGDFADFDDPPFQPTKPAKPKRSHHKKKR